MRANVLATEDSAVPGRRSRSARRLCAIVSEADPAALGRNAGFRDRIDIDSMDVLDFAAPPEELGVEIPEVDYPRLQSLHACVGHLARGPRRGQAGGVRPVSVRAVGWD